MLSVVVPSLGEGRRLISVLENLSAAGINEGIVFATHGERDDVRRHLARREGLIWLDCPRASRGEQLALGANAAHGETLLFLHADTRLPPGARDAIAASLEDPGTVGGAFRLTFDAVHPALTMLSHLSRIQWPSACFGDQGLFCRRSAYCAAGGFRPLPLFEDVDFVRRLTQVGHIARLPLAVMTSARRFLAGGAWRQLGMNGWLLARYYLGHSPDDLARAYNKPLPAGAPTRQNTSSTHRRHRTSLMP